METDQDEQTVEMLVSEFYNFASIAAENIIKQCRAVDRAKAKGKKAFEEFCQKVNLKSASSTTRKYERIGAAADWLLPIADRLPANWTTIYDAARLGPVKAEEMVRVGVLHPQATAKQLKLAPIAQKSDDVVSDASGDERSEGREPCVLQVDASDLSDQDRLALFRNLEELATPHGLVVTGLPARLAEKHVIEQEAA
jgi:hypothetical protein